MKIEQIIQVSVFMLKESNNRYLNPIGIFISFVLVCTESRIWLSVHLNFIKNPKINNTTPSGYYRLTTTDTREKRRQMRTIEFDKTYLSVEELAYVLSISNSKVYRELSKSNQGEPFDPPPFCRLGTRVLFRYDQMLLWVVEKEVKSL
ncbi:MAG: hypothetical protein HRT44_08310 [Bdellovibrionales bacterium]|nr:hypothetical protein [Bdellovibrionales bacterium]NQZ19242.1 hypothetical protein [Bdellovibrionales bacterium]